MKKLIMLMLSSFCAAFGQVTPSWVSPDSSMMIIKGGGPGWTYGGGSWSPAGQTWMQSGQVNNPPVNSAWAELDLSSFAGDTVYVYVMWHKNGPYRPHATHFEIYDTAGVEQSIVVDETKHANGKDLTNDTFSGWYLIGKKRVAITSTTRMRMFKDSTATPSEYMQSDAVMLSKYPVIGNTSDGSVDNFGGMLPLSVSDTGSAGIGSHWSKQGLSEQFTTTVGDSAYAQLDSIYYPDAPSGYYHVDVSWVYYNANNMNVTDAQYFVNDTLARDTVNQNLSATDQHGTFVPGNSVGTWSGFYRLSGIYYYSPSRPLRVGVSYNRLYNGRLVWNMVRFVPVPVAYKVSVMPSWVSPDSSMMIIKGGGPGWTYGGGSWSPAGQTWMQSGQVNNPPVNSAWAELDLSSFAGDTVYVYVTWHVNGPWRGHAVHYELYDGSGLKFSTVVDETKHANGLALANDTFAGWYPLGNKKIIITSGTKLRMFKDSTATSSEYVQSDAVMLSKYPVIDNTSPGSVDNFEYMIALSGPDTTGQPTGIGSHWGKQGLSEQFTFTSGDSACAQLDTSVYKDAPSGYYYVDISWTYYNLDSLNVTNAQYSVNGQITPDTINQNRSAVNQHGSFVEGNSYGTWSGFYRLSGVYAYSPSHPLRVSAYYDGLRYSGSLVWNMVRFVPTGEPLAINNEKSYVPSEFKLFQNYPNPFNPSTMIRFELPTASKVIVQVCDVLGRVVATLVNGKENAGSHLVTFNGDQFASGVYFVRLIAGNDVHTVKMLLLK